MATTDMDNAIIPFPTQPGDPPDDIDVDDQDDDFEEKGTGEVQVKIRGKLCTVEYDKYGFTPQLLRKVLQFE